ncbi:MAG: glycerate kinase [Verrucomicrobia bacterium]|jgi:glycerate 2-kinase|nr:MAG: glycerate kinase [Verrucomicrobiota bacterium]
MRVLLAFDKFKDSLAARPACEAAARALHERHPDWSLDLCPLADGGEGFAEILTGSAGGALSSLSVTGPRGAAVNAAFGLVPWSKIPTAARALLQLPADLPDSAEIAVIEMAAASGLALLPADQRDPWKTTTLGTGQLIAAAAQAGAAAIVLGVGGSATHDLGLGALSALGLNALSHDGEIIRPPVPARWDLIERITGKIPATLPPIRIACDVTNPLLGRNGAAAVYGPQKGLQAADLTRLDHASARLGLLLCAQSGASDTLMDQPGAGAAGGIAFGLMAGTGAKLLPGFELVAAWLDLDARIDAADLILTGEGRFDASSLSGKGPGAVAALALARGKPAHIFAGQVTATDARPGLTLHPITPAGQPLTEALSAAGANLTAAVAHAL